jgi:diadenosine tetraphosphate (Ap4A) HIT family hydrolase
MSSSDDQNICPFCIIADADCVAAAPLARAIRDVFPVSNGHTLLVPRRHVANWFDLNEAEHAAMLALAGHIRTLLDAQVQPSGYNSA